MTDSGDYLRTRYLEHARFAAQCAISPAELDRLLDQELVPLPAYTVTADGTLVSAAFGRLGNADAPPGRYFHPQCGSWVAIAREVEAMIGSRLARHALRQQFVRKYSSALGEFIGELRELRYEPPDAAPAVLAARAETAWVDFMQGIFGVCVADPSSERSIARKEVVQEVLDHLVRVDRPASLTPLEAKRIHGCIDEYARCTMPFAPPEYARSSRRRLVDDFRESLALPAIRPCSQ